MYVSRWFACSEVAFQHRFRLVRFLCFSALKFEFVRCSCGLCCFVFSALCFGLCGVVVVCAVLFFLRCVLGCAVWLLFVLFCFFCIVF